MFELSRILTEVRSAGTLTRRGWLAYGASLAAIPLLGTRAGAAVRRVAFDSNPFSLGVASGDPDASSVVLWTKLAPKPLEPDGGMKPEAVEVRWEIAEDEGMKNVVARGASIASPQLGHSIHAVANGLKPDHWYFYRFLSGDAVSPVGRTRTLPAANAAPDELRFAFASCQHYEQGHFTAYEQMARDDLDLVFHLGDYIYEYPNRDAAKVVRKHTGPKDGKIKTLADYRERHALYRADPLLHGMHARCPWFVTWDDHEFDNNYAGSIQEDQPKGKAKIDVADFLAQRAAAYQAYYEFMPLRPRSLPRGPEMQLFRKASYGRLAEFFVLDTRQYRTDQPNGDGMKPLDDRALAKTNSILGRRQRGWLDAGLIGSTASWNVMAQQVMMGMVGFPLGDEPKYSMDQWPGYAHERIDLVRFLADRKVPNPVVLTGDIHTNWANDLRVDDRRPETPVVATEFVCTSISSGGNNSWVNPAVAAGMTAKNPGVRFLNGERGYVRCIVTPKAWRSDYVVCENVLEPGGKIATRASFILEAGRPGIQKL
ncbi:MAG: alkaline phosphatase D family protein [Isosphaeraceae bacterium]|nr:alkaline phosphatase D family protein [Isosphaeraceae bacterium]